MFSATLEPDLDHASVGSIPKHLHKKRGSRFFRLLTDAFAGLSGEGIFVVEEIKKERFEK